MPVAFPCVDGVAEGFPCSNVGLEARLTLEDLGGAPPHELSDIWGWTDPQTGREIAIVLATFGTAFVDVTEPARPVVLGLLPMPASVTRVILQRDVKVYDDHAFIVSESLGHGLQIFDLTQLREIDDPPATLVQTAHDTGIDTVHNIAINTDTGLAFLVGSKDCEGGLVILDLVAPLTPQQVGCFPDHGYTHDVQCVVYAGPADELIGRDLCFAANETTIAVTDVTDPSAPAGLSTLTYEGVGYTHQGWLTEDQRYFVLGDELDELNLGHPTRTRVFDVSDPTMPVLVGHYDGPTPAVDHNLFIRGDVVYMSNYASGLRVVRLDDPATATMTEVGFFDTVPATDEPSFAGAFSNYPFFEGEVVVVTSRAEGLFVVRVDAAAS